MEKWTALLAAAALAACSQTAEPAAEAEEPAPAITPGTYDFSFDSDGTVNRAVLEADGTYTTFQPDGNQIARGSWTSIGQRTCFDPEGDNPQVCYTDEVPGDDGRFSATSDDGRTIYVTPVAEEVPAE
ncbi:hypothetical protein [Parerythrobacter aestuarii]|uniref:hypothetical protein n=1 Tax=Parerythrobacter aestuarii TaxID=3020909 RepID=UPI0024DE76F2|nr:hypothetical protein [Parerythrobacter aestuarii]